MAAEGSLRARLAGGGLLVLALSGLGIGPLVAQEAPQALLDLAWEEYGLQAFANADRLFDRAADAQGATQVQRWQALLGQAFITQYQMPGRDPEAALEQYQELLDEVGQDSTWRGLILARLGDCHAELDPPQFAAARDYYRQALAVLPHQAALAQETILRLLTTYMHKPDRGELARGLAEAQEWSERLQGSAFAGVFHGLRAEMALFLGDYSQLAEALDSQYRAGINNISVKEMVLFQLARLHEVELDDPDAAQRYYRQLAEEVPSSQKAHFARLRADQLGEEGRLSHGQ
ncbi:MAG: tetratricopeptide repeat protein [Candidatus Latescibacteria bacterium]|nr:tetratricopeptide repeat protein [Candidatus Latescibacterota bacterium]